MSAPLRVTNALKFNMSAVSSAASDVAVDLLRNPAAAKRAIVRNSLTFDVRIGGEAYSALRRGQLSK